MLNTNEETQSKTSDEAAVSSTPVSLNSQRPLSGKRQRDPSQRKNVSFNDVPIVHEVPSHDLTRNSNSETFRSWTYTDTTPSIAVLSPFSSSHTLSPFHSTTAGAQKTPGNRLGSATHTSLNNTLLTRLPEWVTRSKSTKQTEDTNEHCTSSSQLIIVNAHDERTPRSSYTNPHIIFDNGEEKRTSYRSAIMPDPEHYRNLPFSHFPLSESASAYTTILSTSLNSSTNLSSNDASSSGGQTARLARVRSAAIPVAAIHSSVRSHESVSIVPIRTAASSTIPNSASTLSSIPSSRTILKPTTIEFQCSQATPSSINNIATLTTTNTTNAKSPTVSPRITSSSNHARLTSSTNRPLSSSIKYPVIHPTMDSTIKPSSNAFPRSRSAHHLTAKRNVHSPVVTLEGQSGGTNNTNAYTAAKRNPNMRQTYGSHYMHRVLLPANTN